MLGKRSAEDSTDFATSRGGNSSEFAGEQAPLLVTLLSLRRGFRGPRVQTTQAYAYAAGIESLFLRGAPRGFFPNGRTPCVLPVRVGGIDGCFGGRFRAGHIGAFRLTRWFFDFVFTQASGASGSSCVSCHGAGVIF